MKVKLCFIIITVWLQTGCVNEYNLKQFNPGKTAILLHLDGNIDDAIGKYREQLSDNPDDLIAANNLGVALYENKQYDEAMMIFQDILRKEPSHQSAKSNLNILQQNNF